MERVSFAPFRTLGLTCPGNVPETDTLPSSHSGVSRAKRVGAAMRTYLLDEVSPSPLSPEPAPITVSA
mgnify:FL=1